VRDAIAIGPPGAGMLIGRGGRAAPA
jgi:hypothetical protein